MAKSTLPDRLNTTDLGHRLAERTGLSKAKADDAVRALIRDIAACAIDGGTVALMGFGTFFCRAAKARKGRNPKTGESMAIPASKTLGFRPSKSLREHLESKSKAKKK